jgi:hypothetical protein
MGAVMGSIDWVRTAKASEAASVRRLSSKMTIFSSAIDNQAASALFWLGAMPLVVVSVRIVPVTVSKL